MRTSKVQKMISSLIFDSRSNYNLKNFLFILGWMGKVCSLIKIKHNCNLEKNSIYSSATEENCVTMGVSDRFCGRNKHEFHQICYSFPSSKKKVFSSKIYIIRCFSYSIHMGLNLFILLPHFSIFTRSFNVAFWTIFM